MSSQEKKQYLVTQSRSVTYPCKYWGISIFVFVLIIAIIVTSIYLWIERWIWFWLHICILLSLSFIGRLTNNKETECRTTWIYMYIIMAMNNYYHYLIIDTLTFSISLINIKHKVKIVNSMQQLQVMMNTSRWLNSLLPNR